MVKLNSYHWGGGAIAFLAIALVLALFYLDHQQHDSITGLALTGAAVQAEGIRSEENSAPSSVSDVSIAVDTPAATDIQVWQGQYYKGTEFWVGTFDFNFTVYDASTGGNSCYSNTTTLTTGNFGEWRTEQSGVGASCNDASKNYYLEIIINNEMQSPRNLLRSFDFLRKDVNSTLSKDIIILGTAFGSPLKFFGGIQIDTLTNITQNFPLLTIRNKNSGPFSGSNLKLENDAGQYVQLGIGSSQNKLTNPKGNSGGLGYSGGTSFGFTNIGDANWIWRIVDLSNFPVVIHKNIMELSPNGSLILYHGNLDVNGRINATGNLVTNGSINAEGNITASYFLGDGSQLTNLPSSNATSKNYTHLSNFTNDLGFINLTEAQAYNDTTLILSTNTTLENNKVPYTGATNNLNLGNLGIAANTGLFTRLNTTNITAVQYNSVDAGESKTGLTSSQFRVCKKFKVPDNTCDEWCKLEITGGIITNCK